MTGIIPMHPPPPWLRWLELIAVVVTMGAVFHEFVFETPRDRALRDVRLHATVADLSSRANTNAASHAAQKILGLMHRDRVDMTGISVSGITFRMAEFEHADWSDAQMDDAEFICADRGSAVAHLDLPWQGQGLIAKPQPPCTRLRHARFHGASLRNVRFQQADLTYANFVNARLSGLSAEVVDFSDAEFLDRERGWNYIPVFDCDESRAGREGCVSLKRVLFRGAYLGSAVFRGAKIADADFTDATMWSPRFDCQRKESSETSSVCTIVTRACFERTVLERVSFTDVMIEDSDFSGAALDRASFTGVTIKNTDFSGASLAGAEFKNVKFDTVVTEIFADNLHRGLA